MKRHLLITAPPGTGKTTVLIKLACLLAAFKPAGFYTEEIREGGERQGFRLVGLDSSRALLAHTGIHVKQRVGRYGVDVAEFEAFLDALDLPSSPSLLVLMDEIGKMECLSPRFQALVRDLLASGKTVVATVARKGEGLIAEVKGREDCRLAEVTRENRNALPEELAEWVREQIGC